MATLEQVERALRNADAAGDAEAARALAAEYKRLQAATAPEASERPGALERGARGFVQGLRDPLDASKQMFSRVGAAIGLPGGDAAVQHWDADIKARNEAYKRDVRGGQDDFDWGRFGGNMVSTAPIAAALPAGGTMAQAALGGAVGSGIIGGLQPVTQGDFLTEKMKQVGTGATAGAVAGAGANALGRMISPNVAPEVAKLRAEGVTPTPGQVLGGGFKSAEEKAASLPILGSAIKAGQTRANEQFNVAAVNRALAPVNAKLPKGVSGQDAIRFAEQTLRDKYDEALSAIGPVRLDPQLSADLRTVYGQLSTLPKDKADQFARIVQKEIGDRAASGRLAPEAMKAAESNIGKQARAYLRNDDFDVRQLGEALDAAQDALRAMVQRQAPPKSADALKAANTGWANFKRVQRAASYVGAEDGAFNPAQLHSAVKAADRTKDHAAFARGDALMQDLSSAGKKALTNKIPNSGTADRVLGAAAIGAPFVDPTGASLASLAGLGGASLLYTPAGQRMAAGLLAGRQGPTAGLLADSARRLAVPGGVALTPALQQLLAQ
jgi:hypothetical protein